MGVEACTRVYRDMPLQLAALLAQPATCMPQVVKVASVHRARAQTLGFSSLRIPAASHLCAGR
eukprot:scaffold225937_cov24-Tisochrysis_lutea.AAC.1